MNDAKAYKKALQSTECGKYVIAYNPVYRKLTGSTVAAVFLSQAIYWGERITRKDGFFWKTMSEFEEETGLTRREQETARKKLTNLGFIEEKVVGSPPRLHYRVDFDQLLEAINEFEKSKSAVVNGGFRHDKRRKAPNPLTETTTKTTKTLKPFAQAQPPEEPPKKKPAQKTKKSRAKVERFHEFRSGNKEIDALAQAIVDAYPEATPSTAGTARLILWGKPTQDKIGVKRLYELHMTPAIVRDAITHLRSKRLTISTLYPAQSILSTCVTLKRSGKYPMSDRERALIEEQEKASAPSQEEKERARALREATRKRIQQEIAQEARL